MEAVAVGVGGLDCGGGDATGRSGRACREAEVLEVVAVEELVFLVAGIVLFFFEEGAAADCGGGLGGQLRMDHEGTKGTKKRVHQAGGRFLARRLKAELRTEEKTA